MILTIPQVVVILLSGTSFGGDDVRITLNCACSAPLVCAVQGSIAASVIGGNVPCDIQYCPTHLTFNISYFQLFDYFTITSYGTI